MPIVIVNVGRIDSDTIMVEFSDENFLTFTVAEFLTAKRFPETPEPIIALHLMN